jgi:hypothetical protein
LARGVSRHEKKQHTSLSTRVDIPQHSKLFLKYSYFTLNKGLERMSAIYSFMDMYWSSITPLSTMSWM